MIARWQFDSWAGCLEGRLFKLLLNHSCMVVFRRIELRLRIKWLMFRGLTGSGSVYVVQELSALWIIFNHLTATIAMAKTLFFYSHQGSVSLQFFLDLDLVLFENRHGELAVETAFGLGELSEEVDWVAMKLHVGVYPLQRINNLYWHLSVILLQGSFIPTGGLAVFGSELVAQFALLPGVDVDGVLSYEWILQTCQP